jgi:hypothetical protein
MIAEPPNDIKRKCDFNSLNFERNKLVECLDRIITLLDNSTLNVKVKNVLLIFYRELKSYYNDKSVQDLVNSTKDIKDYTETYLANHNKFLVSGVLSLHQLSHPEVIASVDLLLKEAQLELRSQNTPLIKALKQVEPYALLKKNRLDEEFYGEHEEEQNPYNKC